MSEEGREGGRGQGSEGGSEGIIEVGRRGGSEGVRERETEKESGSVGNKWRLEVS